MWDGQVFDPTDMTIETIRAADSDTRCIAAHLSHGLTTNPHDMVDMRWHATLAHTDLELSDDPFSLPPCPSFVFTLFHYKATPEIIQQATLGTDEACPYCWQSPTLPYCRKGTPHIVVEWGGCWQLAVWLHSDSTVDALTHQATKNPVLCGATLRYRKNGAFYLLSPTGGWTIPLNNESPSSGTTHSVQVIITEYAGKLLVKFGTVSPDTSLFSDPRSYGQPQNGEIIVPGKYIPFYDPSVVPPAVRTPHQLGDVNGSWTTPAAGVTVHGDGRGVQWGFSAIQSAPIGEVSQVFYTPYHTAPIAAGNVTPVYYTPPLEPEDNVSVALEDLPAATLELPSKKVTLTLSRADKPWHLGPVLQGYGVVSEGSLPDPIPTRTWTQLTDGVLSITENSTEPVTLTDPQFTVELDEYLLTKLNPAWATDVKVGAPIRIWQGWDNDHTLRLDGYIQDIQIQVTGYQKKTIQLICRDPMVLLQPPCGVVDTRYVPLDFYATVYGTALMGYQALAETLQFVWGRNAATSTGGGHLTPILPDGQQTLFSAFPILYGQPPTSGLGAFWTPPWGSDLQSWVRKVAEYDGCLLYCRPIVDTPATDSTPALTHNNLYYVSTLEYGKAEWEGAETDPTKLWHIHPCYDRLYASDHIAGLGVPVDLDSLTATEENLQQYNSHIQSANLTWHLSQSVNVIEVWAQVDNSPYPLCVQYYEDAAMFDPAADNYTPWKQPLILQIPVPLANPDVASRIAYQLGLRLFGRQPFVAGYTTEGQPTWWGGDVIEPLYQNSGFENTVLRIRQIQSHADYQAKIYTTAVQVIAEEVTGS
jgi:hypothetical protein